MKRRPCSSASRAAAPANPCRARLGLAIVRSVAVAHGGSLWLQDRPGGGLSARVILPLARHHAGRKLAAWLGAACVAGLMLAGAPATRGRRHP